ncbi:MAG: hypothetical protein ACTTKW_08485 [Schwartzia sp. (in: firmicutes)]
MTFNDRPDVPTESTLVTAVELFTKGVLLAGALYATAKAAQASPKKMAPDKLSFPSKCGKNPEYIP